VRRRWASVCHKPASPPRLMTITPIEVSIKRQLTADNLLMIAITSHICPVME